MGDKISQLTSATTLTGTELVPVVQGGTTKKATAADFKTTNAADLVSGTVAAARLPVGSQVNPGILQLGTLSGQACEATDTRLSNSRTPSGTAGGDLSGTYPNPSLAASGVTAGTYGTGNVVPQITVDSKGRVTNVAEATIPIPQAATTNPLPDGVAGPGSSSSYARADHIHQASSTTLTGDVTGTGTGSVPTTLANTGVAQGTYGSSNLVPVVTVDAKGRVLAVSETPFSSTQGGTVTSVDASGGTTGLTVSGGPINNAGTLTLGGTLDVGSGGTGATSAAAALTNLGALPAALKGASSGVAELDSGGKVPYAQLPGALGSSPVATLDGNGKVPLAQLYAGTASGLATLDTGGKVPSAQLPSYVDDIIEVPSSSNFPNPGEIGKIYVTLDTNLTYRWTGSTYVQVSSGPLPSSTTPLAAGTADIGVSLTYARADHVHPAQAVPEISSTVPLVASGTGAIGALTTYARADHVHPAQATPVPTINSQSGTTYTPVIGDANNFVNLTNNSQVVLTIPTDASVAFPNGTSINLIQSGSGGVVVDAAAGVDFIATSGISSSTQGSNLSLIKQGSNLWNIRGELTKDRYRSSVCFAQTFQNLPFGATTSTIANQVDGYPNSGSISYTVTANNTVAKNTSLYGKGLAMPTPDITPTTSPTYCQWNLVLSALLTGNFTLEFSFYRTRPWATTLVGGAESIMSIGNTGASNAFVQYVGNTTPTLRLSGGGLVNGPTLAQNTWYHCCVMKNASSGNNLLFFVNGVYYGATSEFTTVTYNQFRSQAGFEAVSSGPFTYQSTGFIYTNIRVSDIARYPAANYTVQPIMPVQ